MKISQTLNNSEIQIEKEKKIGGNEIISKVIVVCWSLFFFTPSVLRYFGRSSSRREPLQHH